MTYQGQAVTVQGPTPPTPPSPNELSARIEEAIQRAMSNVDQGANRNEVREALRAQIRGAIEQSRTQGQAITIGPRGEGITIQPPFDPTNVIPPQAVDISVAFFAMLAFIIVGLPLARAFGRRMDRKGQSASVDEVAPRLDRIEQAVEAIAIEVERISEGQRFTTKAIADLRGLPGAAGFGSAREAERVPVGERRP